MKNLLSRPSGIARLLSATCAATCVSHSADIVEGPVSVLGPDFIFNQASTGGGDNNATAFSRTIPGLFSAGSAVRLTGIAWASPNAGTSATTVTAVFTEPGADGVFGTADDVVVGTVTDSLVYEGIAGTYVWAFDEAVEFTSSNGALRVQLNSDGNVRRKTTSGTSQDNVKLTLAGTAGSLPPAPPEPDGTLLTGYVVGSSLLTPNGEIMFSDRADIGAGDSDLYASGQVPFALHYSDIWNINAAVEITGLALPLRPGTDAGILTFDFYDPGPGGVFTGLENATLVGSATAGLDADVSPAAVYHVNFASPVAFTAAGSGVVVHITSSGSIRFKIATEAQATGTGAQANRVNVNNGSGFTTNPVMKTSLAGTAAGGTPPPVLNIATSSGFWDEVGWDAGSGAVPGGLSESDSAVIGSHRVVTYRGVPADASVAGLSLGHNTANRGQGRLVVQSGSLTIGGDAVVGRGDTQNDSFLTVAGGSLHVTGNAAFGRNAPYTDGSLIVAAGAVTVAGDLLMGAAGLGGSMLRFHNPGSSPPVAVGGTLVLDRCVLDLTFDADYTHVPGTVTTLATYGGRDGQFLNFRRGEEFSRGPNRFRIDYDVNGNAITLSALPNWESMTRPPNVVLIFTDDQGFADIQLNAHPVWAGKYPMPRLQQLADAGVRFTDAYVTGGVCHPSRVGLLTGRYQQRIGSDNNMGAISPEGMSPAVRTVPDRLRALGVRTYGIGKWHLGETVEFHPNVRGFDRWYGMWGGARSYYETSNEINVFLDQMTPRFDDETGEYLTDRIGDSAVGFIDEHLANAPDQPFFMFVSFTAPHGPNDLRFDDERFTRLANEYGLTQADYLDTPVVYNSDKARTELERYRLAGMTLAIDDNVGKIIDKLAAENLTEDTIVIYLNDNGGPGWAPGTGGNWSYNFPLRGLKGGNMFDGSIRVPSAMAWPGTIPSGQVVSTPVIALDFMATIVNAGNAPAPARNGLDGLDLLPLLRDGTPLHPARALTWRHGGVATAGSAIRVGDWKLHINDPNQNTTLYNIAANPAENNNLAAVEPEIFANLRRRFQAWESSTIAPLYGGGQATIDPGLERVAIDGGYRLKHRAPGLAWISATHREPISLDASFHFRFLARSSETAVSPDAKLAYALADSASRGGFIRAIIDYGAGEIRLEDGKSGASAAAAMPTWDDGFLEGGIDYQPHTRTLTFSHAGASVSLAISAGHSDLTHFAVGAAAMEGELSALVPTDGRSIARAIRVFVARLDEKLGLYLEAGAQPPFDPALLRSPDLDAAFQADPATLIENLGGGLYRATTNTDPDARAEFFIFSVNQP